MSTRIGVMIHGGAPSRTGALVSALLVLASGCAAPPEPVQPTPAQIEAAPPPQPAPPPLPPSQEELLLRFAGTYSISRTLEYDGCSGRIVGRAQTLTVDAARRMLHADNVERTYPARVEGDRLIAESRFPEQSCPESNHFARWIFERTPEGALDGTVESQWLLPPCQSPCVVRFHIVATPLR